VGNQQLSIHIKRLLDYLKSSEFFARESCSQAVIPLPKNLSRKIARFFVSKIGPATGVSPVNGLGFQTKEKKKEKHALDFYPFFVKNISRFVKYQEPGEGVCVSFCHICHNVKMRQKQTGFLKYTRVRAVSRTT